MLSLDLRYVWDSEKGALVLDQENFIDALKVIHRFTKNVSSLGRYARINKGYLDMSGTSFLYHFTCEASKNGVIDEYTRDRLCGYLEGNVEKYYRLKDAGMSNSDCYLTFIDDVLGMVKGVFNSLFSLTDNPRGTEVTSCGCCKCTCSEGNGVDKKDTAIGDTVKTIDLTDFLYKMFYRM